jgi:hypothetical protein
LLQSARRTAAIIAADRPAYRSDIKWNRWEKDRSPTNWSQIMTHRPEKAHNRESRTGDTTGSKTGSATAKLPRSTPSETEQNRKDARQASQHPQSETALSSAQDKNLVPPGSTRRLPEQNRLPFKPWCNAQAKPSGLIHASFMTRLNA